VYHVVIVTIGDLNSRFCIFSLRS